MYILKNEYINIVITIQKSNFLSLDVKIYDIRIEQKKLWYEFLIYLKN